MTVSDWPELRNWFRHEGVDYPWGENPSGYKVWISEIMLQQTQVKAVIPYFIAWMREYPDIQHLASASEERILRSWEGLGYYSRARNIHKTAKILHGQGMKDVPSSYGALLDLPGIGPYTAAAVCSIAFGQSVAVMDANVKRLCQRWGCHGQWSSAVEKKWTAKLNRVIAEVDDPGLFNCSLMQLGQIVCRKANPDCQSCPLNHCCSAFAQGKVAEIPAVKRKAIKTWESWAVIYLKDKRVLLEYRDQGIGRGLWSFPRIPKDQSLPNLWDVWKELKVSSHSFTTNREVLNPVVLVPSIGGSPTAEDFSDNSVSEGKKNYGKGLHHTLKGIAFEKWDWIPLDRLRDVALPAVYRRIVEELISIVEME